MFTTDGLYITKKGYFLSKWDKESQEYIAIPLSLEEIETHLNTNIILGEDVRLHHVLSPLFDSTIFPIVFKRDFWSEILEEVKYKPWAVWVGDIKDIEMIDGDEIKFLEVYAAFEYSTKENVIYNLPSRFNFHGISFPFTTEEKAFEMHSTIGDTLPYSLSATCLTEYMNHPIIIGKFNLSKYDEHEMHNIVQDAEIPISLNILIQSIFWDMSFYGVGKNREDFNNSIN